jgi:hypothetical protein
VITRRLLVAALDRRKVADWVVIERAQELATVSEARPLERSDQRMRWTMIVHQDVPHGRGTARIEIGAVDGDAGELVDQSLILAEAAVGPAWRSTSPSAPAKVTVFDPDLATANLLHAATFVLKGAHRPAGASVIGAVEILRERVAVQAQSGFHATWDASTIRAEALVTAGERSLEVSREARRLGDLDLDKALAAAATDLGELATAGAPVPGRGALILDIEALLHGGGLGVWAAFADHASSDVERQGLTRYRLAAPIAPGADQIAEPLTITSDGALEWGTRSAPVGDEGDSVRRFALIERGIATGLGLSMREAARRHTDPNGGVRNLVVGPGTWSGTLPRGRTIEVRRLRSLAIDPYTGDASLELALAFERTADGTRRPFAGGTVRLDLVAALARARRSSTTIRRGAYMGPAAVLIEDADLLA